MRERDLERVFEREARRRDLLTLKLNVSGRRGWPDRLVIGAGGCVRFYELKVAGRPLRALQRVVIRDLRRRGGRGYVEVVETSEGVREALDRFKRFCARRARRS